MRSHRYLFAGLLLDALLIFGLLLLIGSAPISKCRSTFSIIFSGDCTFADLVGNIEYISYYGTLILILYGWIILPILIALPFVGRQMDRRKFAARSIDPARWQQSP